MSAENTHTPTDFNRAFAIGIALNIGFVAVEAFYGWYVGSLALLADAGHNLSDVVGLASWLDKSHEPSSVDLGMRNSPRAWGLRITWDETMIP